MKLHIFTQDSAEYKYDSYINIISDAEFMVLSKTDDLDTILNSDTVRDCLFDYDWDRLIDRIDSIFDKSTDGVFDWCEKTDEYYEHFGKMISMLNCNIENELGITVATYSCLFSDNIQFKDQFFSFCLPNFYSGNGEPIGAQLALDITEKFMKENQWHIGFYDKNGQLITDIEEWSKDNILNIKDIEPIVWFGHIDKIHDCWSITTGTSDIFIKEFWGDYYEYALQYICNSLEGLDMYYSICEYGIEYDETLFDDILSRCPIDITRPNEERCNALFNLIISNYNKYSSPADC